MRSESGRWGTAANLARGHANLSFPHRAIWDRDANDADLCCESWGGASPEKVGNGRLLTAFLAGLRRSRRWVVLWVQGGPTISYVLWGADGQVSLPALTHSANVHTPQEP